MIPLFIDAIRRGEHPTVHGDGLQSRDFSYVTDAVAANFAAAAAPGEECSGRAYNIAVGESYSLLDLLAILQKVLSVEIEPVHTEPRAGDVRHTRADLAAAHRDLGFGCEVDFKDGLRRSVAWFA